MSAYRICCAGWALPKEAQGLFAPEGSHLERYASRFSGVEINSSFYRPHKPATYARWAASVPSDFRFSVKVPKAITHERRLVDCQDLLGAFLLEVGQLGHKLGCLLVQLPPSLALDPNRADVFFAMLRARHEGHVVIEPRHASWFGEQGSALLARHRIDRVLADPAPCAGAAWPLAGGDVASRIAYYRLHGSPRIYYDNYDAGYLQALAHRLHEDALSFESVWCIFDNTALGAATFNALELTNLFERGTSPWFGIDPQPRP
ncbi:MAG: DUF72 domain-containing protein [Aquabacterium sp.]|uniref:DUF72 domain-containing protein n=1 Tax=Aquabacterium sp. TaxID=1872578 RepID=UPI002721478B|nr:DUF72 domain-containing protein [Aquabacterium sp.]MDO9004453.1 DUF72 domain-containing protein [Aquabacterium sp.]